MSTKKQRLTAKSKGKIALEALRGDRTINEIASKNGLHPTQVSRLKAQLSEGIEGIFDKKTSRNEREALTKESELFEEIGRLKFELDWLKKKIT